jgi:hypothetical protein
VAERPDADRQSFAEATRIRPAGDGTFDTELSRYWSVGPRPHGGYLLVLLANAATSVAADALRDAVEPLAVSAQFLRPPELGPALLRTDVRKTGKTATVVNASLEQDGRSCVEAVVTAGRLPAEQPLYADLPDLAAEPPPDAIEIGKRMETGPHHVSKACDVRLDPRGAGFLERRTDDPLRLRMWVRPLDGEPDVLFALLAGDISMPVTFNLGRFGWTPTVQLTALLRARPAPGWLRIEMAATAVHGEWFDEEATVIDSSGRLVCQARQLALTAR